MPDAIQQWITELEQNEYSSNPQNLISRVATAVAALEEIESSIVPPGPGSIKTITHASSPYTVETTDKFIEADATLGAIVIEYPPALEIAVDVQVLKIDTTANAIQITPDGVTVIDAITSPASATGQINGWRFVYSNGTTLRSYGVG